MNSTVWVFSLNFPLQGDQCGYRGTKYKARNQTLICWLRNLFPTAGGHGEQIPNCRRCRPITTLAPWAQGPHVRAQLLNPSFYTSDHTSNLELAQSQRQMPPLPPPAMRWGWRNSHCSVLMSGWYSERWVSLYASSSFQKWKKKAITYGIQNIPVL